MKDHLIASAILGSCLAFLWLIFAYPIVLVFVGIGGLLAIAYGSILEDVRYARKTKP